MLELLLWLQLKHFLIDFPLQGPDQYKNKGTFGHIGGILHAGLHSISTSLILTFFVSPIVACVIGLIEGILHYFIDYFKMNINAHFNLKPDNSEQFWWLLGFDQLLHQLCYIGVLRYVNN